MDVRLREVERLHLALLAASVCVAYATGWVAVASLLLGGAVMAANLWLMHQLGRRLFAPARTRPALVIALVVAKFAIFLGLLGLLFWRVRVDALAFGIGATLLPIASVIAALHRPPALATSEG
jgi:hypothetical protein